MGSSSSHGFQLKFQFSISPHFSLSESPLFRLPRSRPTLLRPPIGNFRLTNLLEQLPRLGLASGQSARLSRVLLPQNHGEIR
jgi:hypothetical protein